MIDLKIRECTTIEELTECVQLQREVFALPEVELSPVRHFIVTRNAGGFTLGAYDGDRLAGYVLSVPAFFLGERAFYSHMTGVRSEYQGHGVGAKLKWAQRERALADGVQYIKWTFEPVKARNAYFNLEKLGAIVRGYEENFYGTDYATASTPERRIGLASDRLFAEWHLKSDRVQDLAAGGLSAPAETPDRTISVTANWAQLVASDPKAAIAEQLRLRGEFESGLADGLVCRRFARDASDPKYLLYRT